jgi:hypothetical protein
VSTKTKSTKPGQAQDADGGHRPTENGGGQSPLPLASAPAGFAFLQKTEALNALIEDILNDLRTQTFSAPAIENARDRVCNADENCNPRWLDEQALEIVRLLEAQYQALGD